MLLLALAVRLFGLNYDQTHFYHPDERRIAEAVLQLSWKPLQLNPHFFAYGSFPFYVTRVVSSILGLVRPWCASYEGILLVGRAISAVWGGLTVLLLVSMGRRLFGSRVGLLSGLFLAAAVFHLQNSHFATNDVPLTFLVLLALDFLTKAVESGRTRHFAFAAVALGLAVATKVSAVPLLLPLGLTLLLRIKKDGFPKFLLRGGLCTALVAVAFFVGEPYAVLDFRSFLHDVMEQRGMVTHAGNLPYTNQYVDTPRYLYPLKELVLWGLGPFLGLAALAGAVWQLRKLFTAPRAADFVLASWVVPYFLVTAGFDVKFPRYLLPLYPILALWAAALLVSWAERSLAGRLVRGLVVVGTLAYALAFLAIYTRPHTEDTGSRWFFKSVPQGSRILSQDWDEGFPFPLPGQDMAAYKIVSFPFYEPDSPEKTAKLAEELASADYVILQTKRLYGATTQASKKFPTTSRFFYELFAGDLGYTYEREFASRPGLLGIGLKDELADESFTVYDHPKCVVFRNTKHLPAAEIERKITRESPSRSLTRDDLLTARPGAAAPLPEAPPRGRSRPDAIRSSLLAVLLTAFFLQLLSLATYPLLSGWLGLRPGVYALSKIAGVLLVVYPSFLLSSLGLLPQTQLAILAPAAVLVLLGLWARRRWPTLVPEPGERTLTDAFFFGTFAFFLLARAVEPSIYWGEKPMDFTFLNTLYRTTTLPPPEPWLAGTTLSYTYFGHLVVATLGKALSIHPGIMFNIGVALTAALFTAAMFAAGTFVSGRRRGGALAVVVALVLGNLAGVRELIQRRVINFDTFWATSRALKDTINEFPLWSFLFADLHAHVLALPFSVAFLALLVLCVRSRSDQTPLGFPAWALLSLFLGTIQVTNGWSTPTYVSLLAFGLLVMRGREVVRAGWRAAPGVLGRRLLLPFAGVVAGAWLFYVPFWRRFTPPTRNLGWEVGPYCPPRPYLEIFGLFLAILVPFFLLVWRRVAAPDRSLTTGQASLLAVALLVVLGTLVQPRPLLHLHLVPVASIRAFALALAMTGLCLALHRRTDERWRWSLTLASFAFFVTAGCEVVFVWDRMNTIFKFYYDAELLLMVASSAVLVEFLAGNLARSWLGPLWRAALALAATAALVTSVIAIVNAFTYKRVRSLGFGLDGTGYFSLHTPEDAAACEWLNKNVPGLPTLCEAHGPAYQEFSRVTMHTGLPIVLGWDYHVSQRGHAQREIERRKDDVATLYTSNDPALVGELLRRYHVALFYVGPLERNTYQIADLERFKGFQDLHGPIYQNSGVAIFATSELGGSTLPSTVVEEVGTPASGQDPRGRVRQPRGLAFDDEGNLYVADFGNDRIQKFDRELRVLAAWGKKGKLPGDFDQPCGVATGPGGVYVADTWNGRVQVFDRDGKFVRALVGDFYGPRGIAVARDGNVYVADTGNNRIARFDPEGKRVAQWGKAGSAPGELGHPVGIALDTKGRVYVCDNDNARLQVFDKGGKLLNVIPVPGWRATVFSEPMVAVDGRGTVWVTVPAEGEVRSYSSEGTLLRTIRPGEIPNVNFETPVGIAVDPTGDVVVSDIANRVVALRSTPDHAAKTPPPRRPAKMGREPSPVATPSAATPSPIPTPSRLYAPPVRRPPPTPLGT